jgi:putative ubiquitin-RnfH superfamily antitoxin RatB of RatAB toxin-antitoxin module
MALKVEVVAALVRFDPRFLGVFGEPATPETRLRDGDRVEVYRPLQIDPKEARRRRARLAR